ncbi:MAG: two-component regulator propeller domain-containing protein [Spirochaetia bacterium]
MAPPDRSRRFRSQACFLLLFLAGGLAFAQTALSASLQAARDALQRGDSQAALSILRAVRAGNPEQSRVDESFALSVQAALAAGDQYLARYFAQKLVASSPGSPATFQSCLQVASRAYDSRSYSAALEFYCDAVASFDAGAEGTRSDLDMALLRAAELFLYHERDAQSAGSYFHRINPGNIPAAELTLLRAMRARLAWDLLSPQRLGLQDGNVSTLRVDQDDLWIGTWNGGVARYSVSAGRADSFPSPAFPRSVEMAGHRVWVGGTDGLSWYGKATGSWATDQAFQSPVPRKVQTLKLAGGFLYAGTLGDGLFRLAATGGQAAGAQVWTPVGDGALPGLFVTCIEESRSSGSLYIGTLDLGLVIMDGRTGQMKGLSQTVPAFTAANITSVLEDSEERVWIATYGDGLYLWTPKTDTIQHFSKSGGQLGDDWVLAICETDRAIYFGSFGGGVSAFLRHEGTWRRIGIPDGLGSLDVSAIAWRAPYVFFGTLGAGVSVYDEEADGP